jgi:hypothetical protein
VIAEVGVWFYQPLDIQQVLAPLAAARRWILRSPDLSLEYVFHPRDGQLQAEKIVRACTSMSVKQKSPRLLAGFCLKPGNFLLSHTLAHAVPSGLRGLTSVFGMGTGGSPSLWSPRNWRHGDAAILATRRHARNCLEY